MHGTGDLVGVALGVRFLDGAGVDTGDGDGADATPVIDGGGTDATPVIFGEDGLVTPGISAESGTEMLDRGKTSWRGVTPGVLEGATFTPVV